TFPPAMVTAVEPAEANGAGRKVCHNINEILPPGVRIVVPRGFHGTVGCAQRLHELHIKQWRDVEQWPGVDNNRVRVRPARGLGDCQNSGLLQELSSAEHVRSSSTYQNGCRRRAMGLLREVQMSCLSLRGRFSLLRDELPVHFHVLEPKLTHARSR